MNCGSYKRLNSFYVALCRPWFWRALELHRFHSKAIRCAKKPFSCEWNSFLDAESSCVVLPAHFQLFEGFDIKDLNKEMAEAHSFDYSFFIPSSLYQSPFLLSISFLFRSISLLFISIFSFFIGDDAFRNWTSTFSFHFPCMCSRYFIWFFILIFINVPSLFLSLNLCHNGEAEMLCYSKIPIHSFSTSSL